MSVPVRTATLTIILAAVLAYASSVPRQDNELRVGFYQPVDKAQNTLCVDTFGTVVIYPGSLRNGTAMNPDTFSVCLEANKPYDTLVKAMDFVGVQHNYGAMKR